MARRRARRGVRTGPDKRYGSGRDPRQRDTTDDAAPRPVTGRQTPYPQRVSFGRALESEQRSAGPATPRQIPGRPRSDEVTDRVRRAARIAFAERGLAAVTMAEI